MNEVICDLRFAICPSSVALLRRVDDLTAAARPVGVRPFPALGTRGCNPNGVVSSSPGLRGTSYAGLAPRMRHNPNEVAAISFVCVTSSNTSFERLEVTIWKLYQDNVAPLKVCHTLPCQARSSPLPRRPTYPADPPPAPQSRP